MASAAPHKGALEQILRTSDREGRDDRSLRTALLDEIRRVVPFDAHAWLLTDPESEVGCSPLAEVPWIAELPRQIRLKYLTEVNRWTHIQSVALLSAATDGELERSLVWRELLNDHGVTDAASLVFRDRFGCWAFLELWRIGEGFFADAEATFLGTLAPHVTLALRKANASTFRAGSSSSPPVTGPVVLMLSPELEVRGQTGDTEKYLRLLIPTEVGSAPVPAAAFNVGAQLIALEGGVDDHPAMSRVHMANGVWLTLRAARISSGRGPSESDIAVTIERTSLGERLTVFALASGLTPRECELLRLLATGVNTRGVAQRMFVSENTVQDHLKSIFDKTATRSRNTLLARATGSES